MNIEFVWNDDIHALHLPEMDETHHEFIALLVRAQRVPDAELPMHLDRLLEHTRAHFKRESEMMSACRLSSQDEHEAEHLRILTELGQMRSRAESGRTTFVRAYLTEAMPDWFRTHLATMDSELAGKYRQRVKIAQDAIPDSDLPTSPEKEKTPVAHRR